MSNPNPADYTWAEDGFDAVCDAHLNGLSDDKCLEPADFQYDHRTDEHAWFYMCERHHMAFQDR